MKKSGLYLVLTLCAVLVIAFNAQAQGGPPGCCYQSGVRPDGDGSSTSGGGITVSRSLLRTLNVDRMGMLDRLGDMIFAGKRIELVISTTRVVTPRASARSDSTEGTVIGVQEKKFVQIARNRVKVEDVEASSELYVTDGATYVKVSFVDDESVLEQ